MAADADDVLQETLIALADALPFFRGDSSLFTFACAIAHRKVLSLIRTNARRARLMRAAPIDEDASTPPRDPGANREFSRALAQLRPEYREVLILKYVEEIGVSEIARILRLGEHAVESRLARARKALRKELEGRTNGTLKKPNRNLRREYNLRSNPLAEWTIAASGTHSPPGSSESPPALKSCRSSSTDADRRTPRWHVCSAPR